MGNFINTNIPFYHMDDDNWYDVKCQCTRSAKYRCSFNCDHNELKNIYLKYPNLQKYWSYNTHNKHGFKICEYCLEGNQEIKKLFTFHPAGWQENMKIHIDYEPAKIYFNENFFK